jgi:hypothetical protein
MISGFWFDMVEPWCKCGHGQCKSKTRIKPGKGKMSNYGMRMRNSGKLVINQPVIEWIKQGENNEKETLIQESERA